jgi:gas vesicle protein
MNSDDVGKIALAAAVGAVVGAVAMFIFDPDSGRRRRALARDKATGFANDTVESVQSTARDLRNRAQGLAHEAAGAVSNVMPWTGPDRRTRPRGETNQTPGTGAE